MQLSDRKELLFFSTASVVAAFIYYGRFLDNFFAYDDFGYIENIFHGPLSIILGYRTLRVVSNVVWWPLYSVSGFNPFIFNLFSIILHSVNAVLVYLLLLKLIGRRDYAILGGAIFLLSASGCDAIFWKSTNSTLLCLFFYLISLYGYVIYRQKDSKVYSVISVIAFLLAMFSKEDAASLPFIIVLIELAFFGGIKDKKAILLKTVPYAAIVLIYILANKVVFGSLLQTSDDPSKFFKFRPLQTLLAGWTVFFIAPHGALKISDPAIYLTALGVILSFFWVRDKKVLYFGYGWIFLSFLPQSLTSLGQFEPRDIINSISRYLYIPSIGSSMVLASVIFSLKERLTPKIYRTLAIVILSLFICLNYYRVQSRGLEWREQAKPVEEFLYYIGQAMPSFPPNSHVFLLYAPIGRTYLQQALRCYYKRTDIYWIFDPNNYTRQPDENAFFIYCNWLNHKGLDMKIYTIPNKLP